MSAVSEPPTPRPQATSTDRPLRPAPRPWRGFTSLAMRECLRVARLWTQTVLAPVVSSGLFILVFGLSLGGRIRGVSDFDYEVFIVPGLIAMAMAQAAYANNSSSLFQARSDRYVNDVLSAPMRAWQMHVGFSAGGWFRALAIGIALAAVAMPITGTPIREPVALVFGVVLLVTLFGALGVIVGIYAENWDNAAFINNVVILPLAFVGGVFYSIDILPSPWEEISHLNPLFYLVNLVRYGFLGESDISIALCFAVTISIAVVLVAWAQHLFSSGHRLKP
ncbi:MAG: ABC transporter permease [Solirubrobacterales bacterium]